MVDPQLDHRRAVAQSQSQQGQRQAYIVVEVSLGRERARLAEMRAQDRRDHLLDRRLAVGAGDRDERNVKASAPMRSESPERKARVVHHDERQFLIRSLRPRVVRDHRRGGAAFFRGLDEPAPIEALAAQGDEQRTASERAAVGRHGVEADILTDEARPDRGRGLAQAHHRLHRASASSASNASEKGSRRPAISW